MSITEHSNEKIVEAIRSGHSTDIGEAVKILLARYKPLSKSLGYAKGLDISTSEILLKETIHDFVLAVRENRFHSNYQENALDSYIKGILYKKWKTYLRNKIRIKRSLEKYEAQKRLRHTNLLEDNKEINPMNSKLEIMLSSLKELQEKNQIYAYVLRKYWLEGASLEEISVELGKSYQNTRKLHERAKRKLKKIYESKSKNKG